MTLTTRCFFLQYDIDHFNDTYADLKWLESKVGGKAVNKEAGRAVQFSRRNRNKIQVSLVNLIFIHYLFIIVYFEKNIK